MRFSEPRVESRRWRVLGPTPGMASRSLRSRRPLPTFTRSALDARWASSRAKAKSASAGLERSVIGFFCPGRYTRSTNSSPSTFSFSLARPTTGSSSTPASSRAEMATAS